MLIVFTGLIGFIGTPVEPPVESGLSQMQSFSPRLLVMGSRGSANGKVRRRGFRPTGNYRLGDVRNADLPSAALATKDASGIRDEQVVDRFVGQFRTRSALLARCVSARGRSPYLQTASAGT